MPDDSKIKAAIVNEGSAEVERLVARITDMPGGTPFIKTYASLVNQHNIQAMRKLDQELYPSPNRNFLGISMACHPKVNYLEFYSAFKSFPLEKDNKIVFYFEDGQDVNFELNAINKAHGFMKRNNCFVPDALLEFMATTKLEYWKLINPAQNITMIGGFGNKDYNNQYRSTKAGQQLLQDMAKAILSLKPALKTV